MECRKSGKPVELCEECKAEQEAIRIKSGVDQVTPYRDEVRGEITPGNANTDG